MSKFFTRERFGQPQVIAGLLLLMFLGQCAWLMARGKEPLQVDSQDFFRVQEGLQQWRGQSIAGTPSDARLEAGTLPPIEVQENNGYDPNHSPLWYLVASVGLANWQSHGKDSALYWAWLARIPYVIFGALLGASLWYVARRLYGNAGGYIALTLYCFSPTILRSSTLWLAQPEMGAAWGTFGGIFTAIAVAHTLYAPREVILWNWRRILLLGLSLVLAIGCHFSLIILLPITLVLMLYVAPTRRTAALAIWVAASAVGFVLLLAAYGFHFNVLWPGVSHATFLGLTGKAFGVQQVYGRVLSHLAEAGPALLVGLLPAIVVYCVWPRTRYFGNTAPLLVAVIFLIFGLGSPHYPGDGFILMAIPFLFVFVSGIAADLLETPYRTVVAACVWGLLTANALWNLIGLAKVG